MNEAIQATPLKKEKLVSKREVNKLEEKMGRG